jgi:beta-phosphoglucomutase
MKYKAILFDFDGVIANTMDANYAAWDTAASSVGIPFMDKQTYFLMEGMSPKDFHAILWNRYGKEKADKTLAKKEEIFLQIKDHSSLYPGVNSILSDFWGYGNIFLGLVTGGSSDRISEIIQEQQKIRRYFGVVITAEDTTRHKPFPDPYQSAARNLVLKPSDCIVVENSPFGIQSAKRAGMDCVALITTLEREYLSQADYIFENINQFHKWVIKQ